MLSRFCCTASKKMELFPSGLRGRRGAVALEFAILAFPFFLWLLFIFELSFDLFTQEALDGALHAAVRNIQTGTAENLASGSDFISGYLCPAAHGLLECNHMSVEVTVLGPGQYDYSTVTSGTIPMNGSQVVPFNDAVGSAAFCNAQPKQLVLVQALYLGPSFIFGLLPGVLSAQYNNSFVHPTVSSSGFVVEPYTAGSVSKGAAPACG